MNDATGFPFDDAPNASTDQTLITWVVFTKRGGPLTKKISLAADGSVYSDGSLCRMSGGTARQETGTPAEYAKRIAGLTPEQAVALGGFRDGLPDGEVFVA